MLNILQGWHRDCGITSFANDFYMSVNFNEFKVFISEFRNEFLGNPYVHLLAEIGTVKEKLNNF